MRSKAPLALMEQLVMILVFALAAAFCLQAFALSDRLSRENLHRDNAVILAQNTAETLKACGGDLSEVCALLGGTVEQGLWYAYYDDALAPAAALSEDGYQVDIFPVPTQRETLGQALVSVYAEGGSEPVFTLTAAWQKEVPAHG